MVVEAAGVAGVNFSWNSRMFVVGDLMLGLVVRGKDYPGIASYPQ